MKTFMSRIFVTIFSMAALLITGIYGGKCGKYMSDNWIDVSKPAPKMEELVAEIIHDGDTNSYDMLSKYYPEEVLPYAFFMANEHNYGRACHDIYSRIIVVYPLEREVNGESCKIAMSYLEKGAKLGDISCINSMWTELAAGRFVQQDSVSAFHYAYLLYKDSITAEGFVSAGISIGRRLRQIRE